MDWLIALLFFLPAVILAATGSSYLIDYSVYVFVLNRGVRRIVDYYINGSFNPLSPISLLPLFLALLMGFIVFQKQNKLPRYAREVASLILLAYILAGIVGFISTQFAVLYAAAEVVAPLVLMLYAIILNPSLRVQDRWIRSFAWGAILVSIYGWYQYLVVPPWDAFWLEATGMVGYMGIPEPTKMTVFSTMGERGVLAGYLGYSVVPMIVSPKWRTSLGWFGVLLVFSVIILTLSRGGILIAMIATTAFLVVNKGARVGQILPLALVLFIGLNYGLSKIPNSDRIVDRYQNSLENNINDGSYVGRVQIMQSSVAPLLANPQGYGLGAVGIATRINTGTASATALIVDGGYFDILLTYGFIGTALILLAFRKIWIQLGIRYKSLIYQTDHVLLARALMISLLGSSLLGNFLNSFSVLWLAMGTALSIRISTPSAHVEA